MENTPDQFELIPPFCPNSHCLFHEGTKQRFFVKNGWVKTEKPPFRNQRYKCKKCGVQFSENTFSVDFRKKIAGIGEKVMQFSMNGMSNNSISKLIKVAERTVRNRLVTLARQSLYFEKCHLPKSVKEDIAYDGFETFSHSQFSPCYIMNSLSQLASEFRLFTDDHKSHAHEERDIQLGMKQEAALLEKIQLMKIYRNFMTPKFVKKNKHDPDAHWASPAMYLGVAEKVLNFKEVFGLRRTFTQFNLDEREIAFIHRSYPFSRQVIAA